MTKADQMMCFVVIYRGNYLIQQGMQIDDGNSAYQYAKEKGYSVAKWEMYGLTHFWELPKDTQEEIMEFIKGKRRISMQELSAINEKVKELQWV